MCSMNTVVVKSGLSYSRKGSQYMIGIFVFLAGITMGSFFHLVGERLPLKRSILFPRSHCTACKQPLSLREMIPLVSYALLRGLVNIAALGCLCYIH